MQRLGRYEVRARIGEGGMATVYLGRDADRLVAIKVIREEHSTQRDFVSMFLDEASIVTTLAHPNVIHVYETGREGSRLFIAMELLEGQSLWHVWTACREQRVRLRYDVAAWIGARVAEGLHHAHEARGEDGKPLGVVHRDVNASNVFLTYDGQVKVIDFGLAKAETRLSKTAAGVVKGKFAYMSPEQALGKGVDRRTDVFALATTLWELTVDRRLFKGKDDFDTLRKVSEARVRDPRTLVEGYPEELWAVLRRALERDRNKRYATAMDFARALDGFARANGAPDASTLAAVMDTLFAEQRAREAAWIAEASTAGAEAPRAPLRPPATDPALAAIPSLAPPSEASQPTTLAESRLFAPPAVKPAFRADRPSLTRGERRVDWRLAGWVLFALASVALLVLVASRM
jgi:serine/threonine-protein kinase